MSQVTLTRVAVMQMGLSDEFYALYNEVISIYDDVRSRYEEEHAGAFLGLTRADEICRPKVRKAVDVFLKEYTWVFTDQYEWLRPNSAGLKCLVMMEYRSGKNFGVPKYISFSDFLVRFQYAIAHTITFKRHLPNPCAYFKIDEEQVSQHIRIIASERAERAKDIMASEPDVEKPLVIYRNLSTILCNQQGHEIKQRRATIRSRTGELVAMPAHFCITCGRFFVGIETWRMHQKEYELVNISVIHESELSGLLDYEFFGRSELYRNGYSVKRGEMSTKARHELLEDLVMIGTMKPFDIVRDLHRNIRAFADIPRYAEAVKKWREDMSYIQEFAGRNHID